MFFKKSGFTLVEVTVASTIGAFVAMSLPYMLGKADLNYLIWVALSLGTVIITRLPLLIKQDQVNDYLALKGSMIGAIALYPCLIGTVFSVNVCFFVIMVPYLLSTILLEATGQRV